MKKREIKFRVWNSDSKKWETGITMNVDNDFNEYKERFIFSQYTGLKDKNGKEIYDGDIVDISYHGVSEVFYRNGGYKINGAMSVVGFGTMAKRSTVIGNVFENPELLKQK